MKSPRLRRVCRELDAALFEWLLPSSCVACGETSPARLCQGCQQRLRVRSAPVCGRCGTPVAGQDCAEDHRRIVGLSMVRAPFDYAGTGGLLARRAKFQRDPATLRFLARAMSELLLDWSRGDGRRSRVVSVPLHPTKLRRRGFDQAAALAEQVAMRLGLEFLRGALRRCRDTLPQGDVRVTSRSRNVEAAFAVRRPRALAGATVLLVDDVTTSGATARECARVLRESGAKQVCLVTAVQA